MVSAIDTRIFTWIDFGAESGDVELDVSCRVIEARGYAGSRDVRNPTSPAFKFAGQVGDAIHSQCWAAGGPSVYGDRERLRGVSGAKCCVGGGQSEPAGLPFARPANAQPPHAAHVERGGAVPQATASTRLRPGRRWRNNQNRLSSTAPPTMTHCIASLMSIDSQAGR